MNTPNQTETNTFCEHTSVKAYKEENRVFISPIPENILSELVRNNIWFINSKKSTVTRQSRQNTQNAHNFELLNYTYFYCCETGCVLHLSRLLNSKYNMPLHEPTSPETRLQLQATVSYRHEL